MENKKKIVIVVSILLIYFVIMMIFFGFDSLKKKIYHLDVLIAPNTYLKFERGIWRDVKENEAELLGKSYKIYDNHQYLYNGVLQYTDDNWYAFDNNNKPLSLPENFFAYRGNLEMDVINYNSVNMSLEEIEEASSILKKYNITFQPEFTKTLKIDLDFDSDGERETIYIISNALGMEEQSIYFSIAYMKNSDNIEVLIDDVSIDMYQVPSLNLKEVVDINQDKIYELIFEKIYFDQKGTCHEIFEYEKESYKSVKSCELIKRGDEE